MSLVAHYKLNDNAANTNVADSSGNGHTGVASSNTSTFSSASGKIGRALDFNDVEGVSITDSASFSFDDTADEVFSLSIWMYNDGTSSTAEYMFTKSISPDAREWWLLSTSRKPQFAIYDEANDIMISLTTDAVVSVGWHHIVVVYDNADPAWTAATAMNYATIYVDTVAVAQTAVNNGSYAGMVNTTSNLGIGARHDAGNVLDTDFVFFDRLDDARLYDEVLTTDFIAALYNAGNGTEDNPVLASGTIAAVSTCSGDTIVEIATAGDTIAATSTTSGAAVDGILVSSTIAAVSTCSGSIVLLVAAVGDAIAAVSTCSGGAVDGILVSSTIAAVSTVVGAAVVVEIPESGGLSFTDITMFESWGF